MADFFKGLAGGMQTGLQFGRALQERQERERLREAMGLTPQEMQQRQATPEEFGRAQAETQALAARDAQEFGLTPQDQPAGISYAPQMPVEGQRIGPTQYGLGGQTFNRMPTQQEIEAARFGAAANVIAERDPMAAMRMRQDQIRMQREVELAPLQLEQLRGSIAAQTQQGLLTAGQIEDRNRERTRIKGIEAVDTEVAKFLTTRLTGPNGELRPSEMDDNIAALQYRATALQKAGLPKEATDSLKDYQTFAVNQITLDTNQRNAQLGPVAAALAAGDLGPARAFYDRYVVDGAKVTDMKADPKTGVITVSRVRDDGTPMPDRVIKGGTNELLATLNTFKDPTTLYTFSQNEFNNNLKLEELALRKKTEARLSKPETSALEKNLATLERLGVKVSPEEVKSMAGFKAPALSPEAAAQIEIITASLKDNSTPANIESARTAVADIFRGEGLKKRDIRIVSGLKAAADKNDLSAVVRQLQNAGVANETIVGLARQAGVAIPAELLPPAPVPQTGLSTNAPRQPIQLLAPFNAIGDYRRRMQQEQQAAGNSGGLVNPDGF